MKLEDCEEELQTTLVSVILFLNSNGMPLNTIKEMINIKVESAFELYESKNVRKRFKEDFEK